MRSIRIDGTPLSGKSTIGKILADRLGFTYFNIGTLFDSESEHKDEDLKNKENLIVDSNLAWDYIPNNYKVYLKVSEDEAIKRLSFSNRVEESKILDSYYSLVKVRRISRQRSIKLYNVDVDDESEYDIVIDTTNLTPKEVCDRILQCYTVPKIKVVVRMSDTNNSTKPCEISHRELIGCNKEWVVGFNSLEDLHLFLKENGSVTLTEYENDKKYFKFVIESR